TGARICVILIGGRPPMKLLLSLAVATLTASAGEYAILSNGFRIHADSHVTHGSVVRLQTAQGAIEIPANTVVRFETEEYTQPTPPAPVATAPKPVPAEPQKQLSPQELVTLAALHNGLPPEIVHSVARAESNYRTDAVSPKGAIGVMQLMPGTAAQ